MESQRVGLTHLVDMLRKDHHDLGIISTGLRDFAHALPPGAGGAPAGPARHERGQHPGAQALALTAWQAAPPAPTPGYFPGYSVAPPAAAPGGMYGGYYGAAPYGGAGAYGGGMFTPGYAGGYSYGTPAPAPPSASPFFLSPFGR
jgi:hypothetical protein